MALQAPAQPHPRIKLRFLFIAAALALFASAVFALGQTPAASAAGPYQPSDSQFYLNNGWPYNYNGWPYNGYGCGCSYYSYPYNYAYPNYPYYNCSCYNYNYYAPYNYYSYPSYNSYSWCGNNPAFYSYPSAFTCPISPLNNVIYYPWWSGYPYWIP
jgi:hypothetical protein